MYVLPWGQMSIWGATVITSLVTVIPVVGKHILYWLWGGFSILDHYVAYTSNSILKILLVAGNSFEKLWIFPWCEHLRVYSNTINPLLNHYSSQWEG